MFQRLRKHINATTIMAFVALVFALTGGAFAATGGGSGPKATASTGRAASFTASTSKAKKKAAPKGTRGPAGPKGATGATGATGLPGPAGATGPAGPTGPSGGTGPAGNNGSNGTSVTVGAAPSNKECPAGGVTYISASGSNAICNGKNGATGFTSTLPSEKTETGTWLGGVHLAPGEGGSFSTAEVAPISFSIPLAAPLVNTNECGEGANPACVIHIILFGETAPLGCTGGTLEKPTAEPGNLCIFVRERVLLTGYPQPQPQPDGIFELSPEGVFGVTSTVGATVAVITTKNDFEPEPPKKEAVDFSLGGTWAVTEK
jgi:hypothetical protein